jgi:uncharacterized protein YbjT (DUF2867 family)
MKIAVIGGTGLIGKNLISKLKEKGHEAIAASPSTGVNTLTGEGIAAALKNVTVVVDVTNSPSFEDKAVLEFFETSTRNLLKAEKEAGVKHHIVLSVVGTDRFPESGYFRAKLAQEILIKSSEIPYTIVRATQFFEFLDSLAQSNTEGQTVQLPIAFIQPIAAEDVANELARVVLENKPLNGITEIAGPERFRFSDLIEQYLKVKNDSRKVISNEHAPYFGAKLADNTLIPQKKSRLGSINFKNWCDRQKNLQKL